MNCILFTVLAIMIGGVSQQPANSAAPTAQGTTQVVRIVRTDSTSGHMINDCLLVLPDGRYHREHSDNDPDSFSRQQVAGQGNITYVFEGRLTPEEQEHAFEIFDRPQFRAIHSPERLHMSSQFLEVAVWRKGGRPQAFRLSASADYKPNQSGLDPLFDWMKVMAKRKHDVSREPSNSCAVPRYVVEQFQQK